MAAMAGGGVSMGRDPPLSECPEPIAIVGMGCRWPGGVHSEAKLWKMLKEKQSGFSEFKKDRINVDGFYHPAQNHPGSFHMRGGHFLEEDPKLFDNDLFRINAIEARTMDPAQRKLLEVTFEAFENAGEPWDKFAGSRTGVFVGNFMSDHQNMLFRDPDHPMPYVTTGGDIAIHSNRINYVFNLKGPSLTLDTACSSAMYALHIAVSGLRNGDCDAAIVAGTNLISDPGPQMFITKLGALSPSSMSHTFDAAADGYARAEGVGALYIMPLSRAVAGSYPIRAVIRGTAINANGQSDGISHPNAPGQEAVIRQAYKNGGGIDPALTGYFEAHGTGTPVGDPIEVSAIGRVFAKFRDENSPLLIGSIKPNLGHSESASAIASIMKVVMALEQGTIPPTRGITKFNPSIDFKASRTKVVTEMTPWPAMPIRRASVNSFGYGGANAHVVLDHVESVLPSYKLLSQTRLSSSTLPLLVDTPEIGPKAWSSSSVETSDIAVSPSSITSVSSSFKEEISEASGSETALAFSHSDNLASFWTSKRLLLLIFSANDERSLLRFIKSISFLAGKYIPAHLAHTLATRRSRFSQRAFVVAPSETISQSLGSADIVSAPSPRDSSRIISFVFTGQGAQWPAMGKGLFNEYASFRKCIQYQDRTLASLSKRPSWRIEDVLMDGKISHIIHEPIVSQTVCTALQIALVELLSSCGITPSVTVGHSSGEIAAAYAAGRLTISEAIVLAYFRGYTVSSNERKGSMLAVGLGSAEVEPYLAGLEMEINIAAINSPNSVTLSGETATIEKLASQLQGKGVFNRVLKTGGNAYHSRHMQAIGSLYEQNSREGLEEISNIVHSETQRPQVPWISSVSPEIATENIDTGPIYWRQNLESPVLFAPAVEQLMERFSGHLDIFIEIGPHPALAGPVKQIIQAVKAHGYKSPAYLGSLSRDKDDLMSMLELGGNLFLQNAPIDIDALNTSCNILKSQAPPLCLDLPNYEYNYGAILFHENRLNKEWRLRKHLRHDLLGSRQLGGTPLSPSWRNMLSLKDVPWLADHRLIPKAIFPAAGFLAMAMEAAFQHHSDTADTEIAGYTFRNVQVSSTLEVPEIEGADVVLNMQSAASNGNTGVNWFEFKISSLSDEIDSWSEHCRGLVKVEVSQSTSLRHSTKDEESWNSMDVSEWYKKFAALGLEYGPTFRCLSNLKYSNGHAAANVDLGSTKGVSNDDSVYTLHPASLDNCLQLANIAAYSGEYESARQAYIPVMFDDLTIWKAQNSEQGGLGYAVAEAKLRGSRGMYSRVQLFNSSGEALMDMNYFRGISYDGIPFSSNDMDEVSQNPFSRLLWKPDITTLCNEKARELFPINHHLSINAELLLVEKLDKLSAYLLVTLFLQFNDGGLSSEQNHLKYFIQWVCRGYDKAVAGEIPFGLEAVAAISSARSTTINAIFEDLSELVEIKLVRRVYESIAAIFSGHITGLELSLEGDLLADLYKSGLGISAAYIPMSSLVDLLAHKFPRMKILEVGAGTAGATSHILKTLEAESPFRRYQEYTFTDLTPSFLSAAERKFKACRGVIYSILNIELDPFEQGFAGQYDLIIASQVLHATKSLTSTLQNVRRLLKPGGKLLLVEFTRTHPVSAIALGTFPYYWNGSFDGRADGPLAGRDRWNHELLQTGFSGIDIVLGNNDTGIEAASIIMSTAVEQTSLSVQNPTMPSVFIITESGPTAFAHSVAEQLRFAGVASSFVSASDTAMLKGSRCISLLDLDREATIFKNEDSFKNAKNIFRNVSSILWVSNGDIIHSPNPATGLTIGLLRTIVRETPHLRLAQLFFDSDYDGSIELSRHIVATEIKFYEETPIQTDDLQIFRNGCGHISRLAPDAELNSRYKIQERLDSEPRIHKISSLGPIKATTARPGLLSSLQFEEDRVMLGSLPEDWVEIKSEAIDVNVKDIAVATGRFDLDTCSTACCGIVSKVGPLVRHLKIGDRAFGFAPGNFGNFVRVPAIYQQRMELTDKPEELASLPISYMTALYALVHLARVQKGESVLIQSAAGALGLATMRIAHHLGADIYVTVGNSDKRELLNREFGIAHERIFSSRDPETPKKIWDATGEKGIDVIISSTAAEQMQEFWRCIAPVGRFIDVGRLGAINHEKLPMEVFRRNATFSSFDIALLSKQKPQLGASLMAEVVELYRKGVVKPIDYITTFDIAELQEAMMHMSKGTHVGKVVITYNNPDSLLKVVPSPPRARFDPDAMYVLVGCLAGVGSSISSWMVKRGAKHLTYLSRSGGDAPGAADLVERMANHGVEVVMLKCDITVKSSVEAAIRHVASNRCIKGVLHAAAVFEDLSFEGLEFSQLQTVLDPKVTGTINLHEATMHQPLDFFTMTSSIVSVIGTATQASYSAANSFQDVFARFRRAQGLPAQSLALGMVLDVGFASSRTEIQRSLLRNGVYGTSERDLIRLMDVAFTAAPLLDDRFDALAGAHLLSGLEPSKIYEIDKNGRGMDFAWASDLRFGRIMQAIQDHHTAREAASSHAYAGASSALGAGQLISMAQKFKSTPEQSPKEEQDLRDLANAVVAERLAKLLFISPEDIDTSRDMASYGIDSMISAELRNWLFKTFGLDITFTELIRKGVAVTNLSQKLVDRLVQS